MEKTTLELIEKCIAVGSNPAYKGSYAAPREAFRDILERARQEGEKAGREKAIQELFAIEGDKWADALHCSCMAYALVELSGGEESEGGIEMGKRLVSLKEALTNPTRALIEESV